jgi:flagellar assembly protein FliH
MSSFKIYRVPPPGLQEFSFPGFTEDQALSVPEILVFQPLLDQEPRQAADLEADLEAQARRILAEAQERRQHLEREAYEKGYRQGQQDGQEVGRKGLEEVSQRLAALAKALAAASVRIYRQREEDLVALVRLIAHKVVGWELKSSPAFIASLVEQGFHCLTRHEGLKLHLHPQDLEVVAASARETWPPGLELVADGTLTPGGFRLESAAGEVDGTVETRWERVARAVEEFLQEGQTGEAV